MIITQYTIKDDKGQNVTVNKSSPDRSWRLVHDGTRVLSLMESTGYTETKWTLFLAATFQECVDEANRVGLSNVGEFVQEQVQESLESTYRELRKKKETEIEFIAALMTATGEATAIKAQLDSAAVTVAASRAAAGEIVLKDGSKFGSGGGAIIKP